MAAHPRSVRRLVGLGIAAACLAPLAAAAQPSASGGTAAALPYELRSVAARYPVMLYSMRACPACEAARRLLRERGIPYAERVAADGDGELLQRLTGGREVPALTIGNQALRGYSPEQWHAYLDAAGYPRQSRLPAGHPAPAPQPLAATAPPALEAPTPRPEPTPAAPAPAPAPGGIRF